MTITGRWEFIEPSVTGIPSDEMKAISIKPLSAALKSFLYLFNILSMFKPVGHNFHAPPSKWNHFQKDLIEMLVWAGCGLICFSNRTVPSNGIFALTFCPCYVLSTSRHMQRGEISLGTFQGMHLPWTEDGVNVAKKSNHRASHSISSRRAHWNALRLVVLTVPSGGDGVFHLATIP